MKVKVKDEVIEVDKQDSRLIVELAVKWFMSHDAYEIRKLSEEFIDLLMDVTGRQETAQPEKVGLPEDEEKLEYAKPDRSFHARVRYKFRGEGKPLEVD